MFGNILVVARRIAAGNRWLVVAFAVLAGLWALEYLAHGAIGVMRDLATVKLEIASKNAENAWNFNRFRWVFEPHKEERRQESAQMLRRDAEMLRQQGRGLCNDETGDAKTNCQRGFEGSARLKETQAAALEAAKNQENLREASGGTQQPRDNDSHDFRSTWWWQYIADLILLIPLSVVFSLSALFVIWLIGKMVIYLIFIVKISTIFLRSKITARRTT